MVSFAIRQKELSKPLVITGTLLKSGDLTLAGSFILVRRLYQGLTSVYRVADLLLGHFAWSKIDITMA